MAKDFAIYRALFPCLLALAGVLGVWFGYRLFRNGAGLFNGFDKLAIRNREFAVSLAGMSVGGILVLASAVWGFWAYSSVVPLELARDNIKTSDRPGQPLASIMHQRKVLSPNLVLPPAPVKLPMRADPPPISSFEERYGSDHFTPVASPTSVARLEAERSDAASVAAGSEPAKIAPSRPVVPVRPALGAPHTLHLYASSPLNYRLEVLPGLKTNVYSSDGVYIGYIYKSEYADTIDVRLDSEWKDDIWLDARHIINDSRHIRRIIVLDLTVGELRRAPTARHQPNDQEPFALTP